MNLNDLRANAYKNSSSNFSEKSEKNNQNKTEKKSENQKNNVNPQKKTESPEMKRALEALASGGLLKVPGTKTSDGKDSIYRRVAKFLLLIGVDEAAKILPYLTEEQTERIIPEIATIRNISPEESDVILAEFQSLLKRTRESGGFETAREILEKAYGPEKAKSVLKKAVPFEGKKPFDYLNDADSERVYFLLKDESSAIKAVVLSRLNPKKAASVINLMENQEKTEVVQRLVKMETVSPEVLHRLDEAMHEKSLAQTSQKAEAVDGRNILAEILKKMSPNQENSILSKLAEDDIDLEQDLRSRLFTADDVIKADNRFIQEYLQNYSNLEIAYLIADKTEDFKNKIFECISQGRKVQVEDELEFNKPILKKDSEKITSKFYSALRRAFEEGKLIINGRTDDIYV